MNVELLMRYGLILTILPAFLVILLAISMLYCLGLASVALHQAWERVLLPGNETDSLDEILELTTTPVIELTATSPAPQ